MTMPIRYFASIHVFAPGHVFPVVNAPTPDHLHRCADPVWAQIEQEMENRRHPNENPRALSYYACPTLEEAAAYIQYRPPVIQQGAAVEPPPYHYYEVEMPDPTDAVMALFWFAHHHLNHPAVLNAIAEEYWRQSVHQWNYFESIDRIMTVVAEVAAPDQYAVMGVMNGYLDDQQQAQHLWP
jgi:hypothetical protein